jgi:MSHA biogenesis protein MshP
MTHPSRSRPRLPRRSHGLGLVTAIFLLVVLAGLAVAMVTTFTSQQSSSTLDVQGARAYQAARAGIEWGLFQQLQKSKCNPEGTSFPLPADSSLADFVVTVTCTEIGAEPLTRRVIVATACSLQPSTGSCPGPTNSPDYVQRRIEVEI